MSTKVLVVISLALVLLLSISIRLAASNEQPRDISLPEGPVDTAGSNYWTWRGPQHNSAADEAPRVLHITLDPTNSNVVYAGTNQGVYRSSDGGESWEPRNGGLGGYGDLVISSLAIDPSDSQRLIIATWGYGLFESNDGGAQWTRLTDPLQTLTITKASKSGAPLVRAGGHSYSYEMPGEFSAPEGKRQRSRQLPVRRNPVSGQSQQPQGVPRTLSWTPVRQVTINPDNPVELFANIDNGHGIYRSTDGGISWTRVNLGTDSARTYTFAPSNHQIRYASFGSWSTSGGFYRTSNGGATWSAIDTATISGTVIAVAVHPTDPNTVLAGTSGEGLYRSTSGGNSWTRVSTGLDDDTFFSVAFAPSNPNIVYAGGYWWVYRSTDGGATWSNADTNFPTFYVQGLSIHPSQPETVWVGANKYPWGGVYKRTSSGESFVLKPNGMEDTFVLDIEQDPNDPNILYAATWGGGVFRSDNGGSTWNARYGVPYVYTIKAAPGPTGTILYAGTFYNDWGILKSYDQGDSWTEVSRGYSSDISFDIETVYDDSDSLIAATSRGIEYSYDGGQTWHDANGLDTGVVLHLCEFPGTGRLLAATYGGGLFYSWGGYSWYEANVGVASVYGQHYTYDVTCSPDVSGLAYAGSLGVYRTTDYGEHWQSIKAGLPNDYFRAIDIVPGTGDVFASSYQNGVYLAPNGNLGWSAINDGLAEQRTRSIKIVDSSPIRVFVGTNGQGAWDYTLTSRPAISFLYLPLTLKNHSHTPLTCHTFEPNDDFAEAYRLSAPGTVCSYVASESDEDYFYFDIDTTGPITVELTDIPLDTDYDIVLYDSKQLQLGGSWWSSNHDERIVFQPLQTGRYYVGVYSYNGSSQNQPYRLTVSCNGPQGAGQIYGTVTDDGSPVADLPVSLAYYNGYHSTRVNTLTDQAGNYRFRGMTSLPVGHTYYVNYPNYEGNNQRLAYWSCWSFTGYKAGESFASCNPDIEGVALTSPSPGETHAFPIAFQWTVRGIADEQYQIYLRRWDPSYAYYYSPYTTGGSYTLESMPSGFSYDDTNWWSVNISNDLGYGASYYMRSIAFSSAQNFGGAQWETADHDLDPVTLTKTGNMMNPVPPDVVGQNLLDRGTQPLLQSDQYQKYRDGLCPLSP